MKVGRRKIDGSFDGSIQTFQNQNQGDRKCDDGPFGARNLQPCGQATGEEAESQLNPRVALSAKEIAYADEGEVKGADQAVAASIDGWRIFGVQLLGRR